VSAKNDNLKKLSLSLLCWAALLVITFKARFYELYLPNENLTFGDFKYVLSCGNFEVNDLNCNEYMYGRWLLVFLSKVTFLHPYPEQTTFVIIAVSLLAIAHLLMSLKNKIQRCLAILLLLSPSVALLIQRGNLDIVVFFMCWYAIKFFFGGQPQLGLLVAVLASAIKIYPVALFAILVILFLIQKKSITFRILWLCIAGMIIWSSLIDIGNIPWLPSDARNSFGLRVLGEYITYAFSGSGKQMSPLLGSLLGGAFLGVVIIFMRNISKTLTPKLKLTNQETYAWGAFFVCIYISGISVDYRLIFLLPIIAFVEDLKASENVVFSVLVISTFYFSFPFEILQVAGDLALSVIVSILLLMIFNQRPRKGVGFQRNKTRFKVLDWT
jgi:hypothetical protein